MDTLAIETTSVLPAARTSLGAWLQAPKHRYQVYLLVAVGLFGLAYLMLGLKAYTKQTRMDFLVNDAPGYYAYLPSILIDHDLDFRNQIADQFGSEGNTVGPSTVEPRWPIGLSVTLLPAFLAAHGLTWGIYALTHSAAFVPNGYSVLYQPICVAFIMLVGAGGMVLTDKLLVERFRLSGLSIVLGVGVYWLGTQYTWYYFREPFMVHVVGASWIMAVVFLIHRMLLGLDRGELRWQQLLLLASCMSVALICRMTNGMLLPLFVYLLYRIIRTGLWVRFLKVLPIALLGLAPLLLQLVVQKVVHGNVAPGSVQQLGYDPQEGFRNATDPRLWKILFSSRHGLFFWAPVLLLSMAGLGAYLIKGPPRDAGAQSAGAQSALPQRWDPLLLGFMASGALLWYVNSAWYAWWFGSAFGARAFIEISGLFVIGLAFAFEFVRLGPRFWRYLAAAVVVAGVSVTYLLMAARMLDRIPRDGYLFDQHWHLRGGKGD
jgi:hypothetical protein